MNTIAELKRRMTVGKVVHIENRRHPELSGDRPVATVHSNQWAFTIPDTHPDPAKHGKSSWLAIPKRDRCEFDGDTVTIDGWLVLTVPA